MFVLALLVSFLAIVDGKSKKKIASAVQQLNEYHEKNKQNSAELHVIDGMPVEMSIKALKPSQQCNAKCNVRANSTFLNFKESEIEMAKFMDLGDMKTVTPVRKRASYILLRAALMTCQIGDVVETGVFTGGSSAVILKTLKELDDCNRKYWVFDSFEGLPKVGDKDKKTDRKVTFAASQELFTGNLKSVGVWNESKVIISKGWFSATVPISPVKNIAFLRLDGDLYVSTKDAIEGLYPKLMKGGYIYIDDYGSFVGCKTAVDEYRGKHNITEKIHQIVELDGSVEAVWWRKD